MGQRRQERLFGKALREDLEEKLRTGRFLAASSRKLLQTQLAILRAEGWGCFRAVLDFQTMKPVRGADRIRARGGAVWRIQTPDDQIWLDPDTWHGIIFDRGYRWGFVRRPAWASIGERHGSEEVGLWPARWNRWTGEAWPAGHLGVTVAAQDENGSMRPLRGESRFWNPAWGRE